MTPIARIALTGGIATGKSYCLARFAELGAPTIDADVLSREAVAPGSRGLAEVVDRFGPGMLTPLGDLNRKALAAVVFADPNARRDLEAIVHPRVYAAMTRWFTGLDGSLGIADIPLLYESGREREFDRVIVAACPLEVQRERLRLRGLSAEETDRRLAAQWPIAEKSRRADYVIDTSGTTDDTNRQVADVWKQLNAGRA